MTSDQCLTPSSHLPHASQCAVSMPPLMRRASDIGLSRRVTPSGMRTISRIGPTNFFSHHDVECRMRAAVKYALIRTCTTRMVAPYPEILSFSSICFPSFRGSVTLCKKRQKLGHVAATKSVNAESTILLKGPSQIVARRTLQVAA